VRINHHVSRQSFCAVLGVSEEGQCFEVLARECGDREHIDLWESVLRSLLERVLNREAVEVGIMDGLPGLESFFSGSSAGADATLPETRQSQHMPPGAEGGAGRILERPE